MKPYVFFREIGVALHEEDHGKLFPAANRSRVVLATGGLSLPKTGSDGPGLEIARGLGHSVVPTTPALVPLVLGGASCRRPWPTRS